MTPDAHMVETLRLRTAALHRVSRSNDLLRRENDDLRARLDRVRAFLVTAPVMQHANGYPVQAIPKAELLAAIDGKP